MPDSTAQVVSIGAGIMGRRSPITSPRGCDDVLILEQAETEISGSAARSAAGLRHQFSTEVNLRLSLYGVECRKHFSMVLPFCPSLLCSASATMKGKKALKCHDP